MVSHSPNTDHRLAGFEPFLELHSVTAICCGFLLNYILYNFPGSYFVVSLLNLKTTILANNIKYF